MVGNQVPASGSECPGELTHPIACYSTDRLFQMVLWLRAGQALLVASMALNLRTERESNEIYANGMLFLKSHLRLTQASHRLKILAWVLKPKFHAMLHLLDQSHKWRYNTRYTHCFAGEDAMGWLKRVSLRAPRKPGKFNVWVARMGMLKMVAAKRRLTTKVRRQGWNR